MPRYVIEGSTNTNEVRRRFSDLLKAEQAARNLCRKYTNPVRLRDETGSTLAMIRTDATGRVWTDLEQTGATLL